MFKMRVYWFLVYAVFSAYGDEAVDSNELGDSEKNTNFDGPLDRISGHWLKNDKVILDCDGGITGITALLFLLKAEQKKLGPKVIAVTTVSGVVSSKQAAINVIRALAVAGRTDIPCYIGADVSLSDTIKLSPELLAYAGVDGIGDVPYDPAGLPSPQDKPAALALIKLVKENKGRVVIITAGAVTNLALAIRLEKRFLKNVKKLYLGVGSFTGVGTILHGIDYKSWKDPDALKIVWNNTDYEKTFVIPEGPPYQVNAAIPAKFWLYKFYEIQDPIIQFIKEILQVYWDNGAIIGYVLYDPITVASYLWPQIVDKYEPHRVTVSTNCDCRGATFGGVTDIANRHDDPKKSNAYVAQSISAKAYVYRLLKLFGQNPKSYMKDLEKLS